MQGTLLVCATPIGNLGDITLRVLESLKEADLIAAEDTRTTQKLLNHYQIKTPCTSYHKHNEKSRSNFLITELMEGKTVALVSDAGTPGISDPGHVVITAALEAGINVVSLPGPSACIAALVVSGLPADRFAFEGFLPRNAKQRREKLTSIADDTRTLVFYESPHRLPETIRDLLTVLGDRKAAVIRELTKKFEEVLRGNLSEIEKHIEGSNIRGEYVLVIEGSTKTEPSEQTDEWKYLSVREHVELLIAEGATKKEAIKEAAELRGLARRDVYNYIEKYNK